MRWGIPGVQAAKARIGPVDPYSQGGPDVSWVAMPSLKMVGFILLVVSVGIWGGMYYSSGGASTFANLVLLIGVGLAGTFWALDWAESYTA